MRSLGCPCALTQLSVCVHLAVRVRECLCIHSPVCPRASVRSECNRRSFVTSVIEDASRAATIEGSGIACAKLRQAEVDLVSSNDMIQKTASATVLQAHAAEQLAPLATAALRALRDAPSHGDVFIKYTRAADGQRASEQRAAVQVQAMSRGRSARVQVAQLKASQRVEILVIRPAQHAGLRPEEVWAAEYSAAAHAHICACTYMRMHRYAHAHICPCTYRCGPPSSLGTRPPPSRLPQEQHQMARRSGLLAPSAERRRMLRHSPPPWTRACYHQPLLRPSRTLSWHHPSCRATCVVRATIRWQARSHP